MASLGPIVTYHKIAEPHRVKRAKKQKPFEPVGFLLLPPRNIFAHTKAPFLVSRNAAFRSKKSVNLESTSFLETTSKERKRDVNEGDCHHSTTPVS